MNTKDEQIKNIIREELNRFSNLSIFEATNVNGVDYIVGSFENKIIFTPKTSVDFDKFEANENKNIKNLENKLNKINSKIKFNRDYKYHGAGVAFVFDNRHFINKNL